jgi:bifunctional non-homologous end joining protein LigD
VPVRRNKTKRLPAPNALNEYAGKRHFDRTPEPHVSGDVSADCEFVVQKHAARKLHYDLRLELDGVLKSWAITRGPSLTVGEKRLAVRTEDHPIEYLHFEGNIPKGEYGGGSMIIWDRGRWLPEGDPHRGLQKGHLAFSLDGKRLKGRWHLVRIRPRTGEKNGAVAAHEVG